jgi:peptidoglycan/LPS O-acetylase OafA/YrhL
MALAEINGRPFLKSISWIGDITYSSYLLHFPLQLIFALTISLNILSPNFYLEGKYLAIYYFILITISYFTYKKFEMPAQKFLREKWGKPPMDDLELK